MSNWMAPCAISLGANLILAWFLYRRHKHLGELKGGLARERLERGRMADAYRELHSRLGGVFASPLVGVHFWEGAPGTGSANLAFCRMLGLDPGEPPSDQASGAAPIRPGLQLFDAEQERDAASRGMCAPFEREYLRGDGTRVDLLVAAGSLEGYPLRGVCLAIDITRHMEAKRELRMSQERYRVLAESSPVGIWHIRPDGRTIYMNPAMCRVLEVDAPEEVISSDVTYHEFFTPESQATIEKQQGKRHRVAASTYEVEVVGRWGRRTRMLLYGAPVLSAEGQVESRIGTFLDITEHKREEEALRRSEERFRVAAECSNDLIYEWDLASGRLDWFGPLEERLGFAAGEIPRTREAWEALLHPEDLRRVAVALERHMRHRRPHFEEYRIRCRDGSYRIWTDRGTALWDAAGRPSKWISATTDVTEGRNAEQALRSKEEQLRQSQKLEAVGRLAGGIAHDFNNMLAAIMGYCDLMLIRLEPAHPCRREVGEILNGSERAAGLIRQLLAFSRQEIPQPRVINPNAVITAMEHMMRHLVEESIELRLELEAEVGSIRMDPVQVEQVVLNLVLNARDAMPGGGDLILKTSGCEVEEEIPGAYGRVRPGPYLRLSVGDSGLGIDKEHLPHIFDPFFTTKDRGRSTGLGLSTVYGIVTQNQGCVRVETEVGKGSVFSVFLPLSREMPDEESEMRKALRTSSLVPKTVLLVEDDDEVRNIVRELLSQQGFVVIEAQNGAKALDLAGRYDQALHLLLTDVVLPGMGGKDLAGALQRLIPDLRVLFMSGYTQDAAFRDEVTEGNRFFIQKPFTMSTLIGKIKEVLL